MICNFDYRVIFADLQVLRLVQAIRKTKVNAIKAGNKNYYKLINSFIHLFVYLVSPAGSLLCQILRFCSVSSDPDAMRF